MDIGDRVVWVKGDVITGPQWMGYVAIKLGDIREIIAVKDEWLMLSGRDGRGFFGWTEKSNVVPIESAVAFGYLDRSVLELHQEVP